MTNAVNLVGVSYNIYHISIFVLETATKEIFGLKKCQNTLYKGSNTSIL